MIARNLKHKITFQNKTKQKNSFNEELEVYEDVSTVRASIETFSSKETFFTNKITEVANVKFRVRYLSEISTDTIILYNNKTYDIVEIIDPYERRKELIIAAKEIY